jgi:phage terminase Nu1 subunit (DNA packaging protein)
MGYLPPLGKGGYRPEWAGREHAHRVLPGDAPGRGAHERVQRYCAHPRDLATGRGGESAIASATAERARLARAQADLVETKGKKLRGELVDTAEVEAEWSGVLRTVRAGVLAVPLRCAQRLPHLTPHDVIEIDTEVREALTEIGSE